MKETFIKRVQGRQYDLETGKISLETVKYAKSQKQVQFNSCSGLLLNLQTYRLCGPKCCKPDTKGRTRVKSYQHLLQEVSISHIIQSLRVLKAATQKDRSARQWNELVNNHALLAYDDFKSDDDTEKLDN